MTAVTPTHGWITGIDVSHNNGWIDWDTVASWRGVDGERVRFAFIRTGDGKDADRQFRRNWAEARRVGLKRGIYHLLRGVRPGVLQAAMCPELEPDDMSPVIDVEDFALWHCAPADVLRSTREYAAWIETHRGRKCHIYTGESTCLTLGGDICDGLAEYCPTLWLADYRPQPVVPAPWKGWLVWQWTDEGTVDGIPRHVDMNWVRSEEELTPL